MTQEISGDRIVVFLIVTFEIAARFPQISSVFMIEIIGLPKGN